MSKHFIHVSTDDSGAVEWTLTDKEGEQKDVYDAPMKLVGEFDDTPDEYYDNEPNARQLEGRKAYFNGFADGYMTAKAELLPDDEDDEEEESV